MIIDVTNIIVVIVIVIIYCFWLYRQHFFVVVAMFLEVHSISSACPVCLSASSSAFLSNICATSCSAIFSASNDVQPSTAESHV